jgi:hypothetical protein
MTTFIKLVGLAALLLVSAGISGCNATLVAPTDDISSGTLPSDTDLRKTLSLSNSERLSSSLSCHYGPTNFNSDKNLVRTTVYGLGTPPAEVEVERRLGGTLRTGLLPSFVLENGWQTSGHALDCSVLGCAGGSYHVKVSYTPALSGCPSKLSLELTVPPS